MSTTAQEPTATPPGVEPAVAPPPGSPRFPLVDSLRAIAALSVVVYHAAFLSRASDLAFYGPAVGRLEIGVAVFFVISGFLLYRPFVAANLGGHARPRTRAYLWRRALRIVPAYWLALTALAIYPGLQGVFTEDWWIYYLFGQIYSNETFIQGIPQAWTLCVEVTFYLALPVYAALMGRVVAGRDLRSAVRIEMFVLVTLALLTIATRTALIAAGPTILPYTLIGMFDWFAAGMALAVASVALASRSEQPAYARLVERRPWLPWLGAAALFAVLAATVRAPSVLGTIFSEREHFELHVLSLLVGALLVLPAVIGTSGGGLVRRILANRLLAWLGLISYGIYLWHYDLMHWAAEKGFVDWLPHGGFPLLVVIAIVMGTAAAAASYYGFERPLLRFKDGLRRRAG